MAQERGNTYDHVGPVLQASALTTAIVAAIRELNNEAIVLDRGAYLRVLSPLTCIVTRPAIEKHLGRPVRFPGELEAVLSAFKGKLRLSQDEAVWEFGSVSREE
jgi:toluene monooxygenase system protein D